jgi:hypothetical protein
MVLLILPGPTAVSRDEGGWRPEAGGNEGALARLRRSSASPASLTPRRGAAQESTIRGKVQKEVFENR